MLKIFQKTKTLAIISGLWLLAIAWLAPMPANVDTHSMIVQGDDLAHVKSTVIKVGGKISRDLDIINALDTAYSLNWLCQSQT